MLKTLIGKSANDPKTLEYYVIAASFPKMLRRLNGTHIPRIYFDCLSGLSRLESKSLSFLDQPVIATMRSKHDDHLFLGIIPSLRVDTDISNLRKMAKEMGNDMNTSCKIYNENTYMEFHRLLCELLRRFHGCLNRLRNTAASAKLEDIKNRLKNVMIIGQYLQAMVRSAAIEKHLKTLAAAKLLNGDVDDEVPWMVPETTGEFEDADDAEFHVLKAKSVHQGQPLLLWQSYRDWLRLTTHYFDATAILRKHVKNLSRDHHPAATKDDINIDIKILAPSLPDQSQKMLPWKDLLRHKVYFPELPDDVTQTSAEELITFLTSNFDVPQVTESNERGERNSITEKRNKALRFKKQKSINVEHVVNSVKDIIILQEKSTVNMDNFTSAIETVINQVTLLNNSSCSSLGWGEYAAVICEQLQALNNLSLTPDSRLSQTRKVLETFEAFKGNSLLYQRLKEGTALSKGFPFYGTRHCEVCIASCASLPQDTSLPGRDDVKVILDKFLVSHISYLARIFVKFYNIGNWTSHRGI